MLGGVGAGDCLLVMRLPTLDGSVPPRHRSVLAAKVGPKQTGLDLHQRGPLMDMGASDAGLRLRKWSPKLFWKTSKGER